MIRAALALVLLGTSVQASECGDTHVDLRGDWGQARFRVEIADDTAERAQGLMHRESLATSAGMLFIYQQPQHARFWMKDTLIPLDLLFFDESGNLTQLHENAQPHDLSGIDGGEDVLFVLEINAGIVDRFGINPGSTLRHPAIDPDLAVWTCD